MTNPDTRVLKYFLVYQFGPQASVRWDPEAQRLVWTDMIVSREDLQPAQSRGALPRSLRPAKGA